MGAINAGNIIADDIIVTGHLQADTASLFTYGQAGVTNITSNASEVTTTLVTISYNAIGNGEGIAQLDLMGSLDVNITSPAAFYTQLFAAFAQIWVDGVQIRAAQGAPIINGIIPASGATASSWGTLLVQHYMVTTPGAHTITLEVAIVNDSGNSANFEVDNSQIRIMESMR